MGSLAGQLSLQQQEARKAMAGHRHPKDPPGACLLRPGEEALSSSRAGACPSGRCGGEQASAPGAWKAA